MNVLVTIFLFILVAENAWTSHVDPSACQRVIKFMLISACGATKREFQDAPVYQVMTEEEIERRYHDMVRAKMIKGVEKNSVDMDVNEIDDIDLPDDVYKMPQYQRLRRSVIGIGMMKTYAETSEHERRGSFHFIGRLSPEREDRAPPPGELKAKCCGGVMLCTMDDFRGFCE